VKQEQAVDVFKEVEEAILNFIGGKELVVSDLNPKVTLKAKRHEYGGAEIHGKDLIGHIGCPSGTLLKIQFRREVKFSTFEKEVINEVFRSLSVFCKVELGEKYSGHRKVAINGATFDAAVARTARGTQTGNFWRIHQLFPILKKLCWQKYEGTSSTSGFIFVGNIKQFKKLDLPETVRFIEFDAPMYVDNSFFSGSLSYRYIDGKRACYIVDQNLKCHGILQSTRREVSWSDLLIHKNFSDFLMTPQLSGRAFGIFSNSNGEIDLLVKGGNLIRWVANGWKLVDREILKNAFCRHIEDAAEIDELVNVVLSISAARYGALILLPNPDSDWKSHGAGYTDTTMVGEALRKSLIGKSLSELERDGLLLKILSSDGSVIVDNNAKLVEAGVLFRLLENNKRGGSRTAAARSASRFGLAIKVSVDGPIQIYQNKDLIFQI
jgi:hypothetical protein